MLDGDTIDKVGERIRLFGIDAPEAREPGGSAATAFLRRLVQGRAVECRQIDRDRYGRIVALCAAGGVDLSLAMIHAGHAVAYCLYLRRQRPDLLVAFRAAEAEAKAAKRGLWATPFREWRDWHCAAR